MKSRLKQYATDPVFGLLLFGVLFASANFGLINQRLAVHAGNGQNLLGLRDALLLLLLLFFLPNPSLSRRISIPRDALAVCGCMVALAVVTLLRSVAAGRSLHYVLGDFVGFVPWCLPFVVAPRVAAAGTVRRWWTIICWLGVAVSLCSIIETQLRVPIVTGSGVGGILESQWARSTPSCWALMILAAPTLLVGCFGKHGERRNPLTAVISAGGWVVVFAACLLTQSRTLLVGLVVGVVVLWILDRDPKHRTWLLLTILTIPLWIGAGALLGERLEGKGFSEYYAERYRVIAGVSEAIEYAPRDGRIQDIRDAVHNMDEWLWFGVGFAGTFADPSGEWSETGRCADSVVLDFATRFGVLGILLLGWFILINLRLARGSPQSDLHKTIAAGLLSVIACSFFGNALASSYMAPVVMIAFSLLLASVATGTLVRSALGAPGEVVKRRLGFASRETVNKTFDIRETVRNMGEAYEGRLRSGTRVTH